MSDPASRPPRLTIVVAALREEWSAGFLEALGPQVAADVEVLVMSDRDPGRLPPWVCGAVVPGALAPVLWGEGIRRARGEVVACTSAAMTPAPDWVAQTLALHGESRAGGFGGPIEPSPGGLGLGGWAVYFCRYSPYARPIDPSAGLEVAADNASYRGDALRAHAATYDEGFWEPFVHRAMRAAGQSLEVREGPVVFYARPPSVPSFCQQRLRHGYAHGRNRARSGGRVRNLLGAATAPLVPAVMFTRATRATFATGRHRMRFVLAAPLTFTFYACWATGELGGRLRATALRRE